MNERFEDSDIYCNTQTKEELLTSFENLLLKVEAKLNSNIKDRPYTIKEYRHIDWLIHQDQTLFDNYYATFCASIKKCAQRIQTTLNIANQTEDRNSFIISYIKEWNNCKWFLYWMTRLFNSLNELIIIKENNNNLLLNEGYKLFKETCFNDFMQQFQNDSETVLANIKSFSRTERTDLLLCLDELSNQGIPEINRDKTRFVYIKFTSV